MALNLPKSVLLKGFRVLPSTLGSQRPLTGCWNKPTATATNPSDITSAQIHLTRTQEYPQVAPLPLPDNIDQYIQFSPHRTRDINCHQLALANSSYGARAIDMSGDPRMCSYDAHATVNLNCMMQSTVPEPFSGSHKFTHLNMPGGQWAANGKYLAQDLQANHYTNLRQEVRSRDWDKKGPFFTVKRSYHCLHLHAATNHTNPIGVAALHSTAQKEGEKEKEEEKEPPQDKKTKLKQAFKEYGSTVVVFHVGISLMSLGMFYALVSSGLDVMAIVEYLNLGDSVLASKAGTGASTFVIAYTVHKIFAPVRISITLGATPFIVRMMRKRGFLKAKSK